MKKLFFVLIFLTAVITSFKAYAYDKNLLQGWYVDGVLIPPQCLPHPFISEDNFESFANFYKIDLEKLKKEPGQFFGHPIKDLNYIPDEWAIDVIASLDECGHKAETAVMQPDGSVLSGQMPDADGYKILGRINPKECSQLIPHYPVKPELCYAINVTEYMSGTMGRYDSNYIYGLIREKHKNYILPLLSLDTENSKTTQKERSLPCTLKNTEFCGVWQDTKGKDVVITGDKIIYKYYDSTDTCKIMKEARLEDGRPLSLLICDVPSTEPGFAYTEGYMLVMRPQGKWGDANSHWVHKLMLGDLDPTNPCFSDDAIERQSCDLLALYEQNKRSGHDTFGR